MAGAQLAGLQQRLDRMRQGAQTQRVGDVASALPEVLGQSILGVIERLHQVMEDQQLSPSETTVFVVAHGNPDPDRPASHDSAVMLATRTYSHFPVQAMLPAFLEEKPFLKNWEKRVNTPNVIVLPFMIAAGTHGARDIPEFLGIELSPQQEIDLHENGRPTGPFEAAPGRLIWLIQAIGSHPRMAEFIVDIAREKLASQD